MMADGLVWLCVMIIAFLAARDDWRGLQIANQHSLVLLILFPLAVLSPAQVTFIPGLLAACITLFLGLILYALKQMGGGDVKFASVLALYSGLALWPHFMLLTMLNGGVLALVTLYLRRYPQKIPDSVAPQSWLGQIKAYPDQAVLPYGIALAAAACVVLIRRLVWPYMV
jgi:prepilin peptidase CpaA